MVGLRFGWWGWDTAWVIFMAMVRSVGFGGLGRLCMLGGWCRDMLVGGASPWWGLGLDGGGGTLPESLWGTWPWSGLWALVVVVVWACWVGVHLCWILRSGRIFSSSAAKNCRTDEYQSQLYFL